MFTRVVLPSPADLFLVRFEGSIPLRWWLTNLGDLNQNIGELGNILLNSSPPWIKLEDAPNYADGRFWYISSFMYNRFTDEGVSKATELSSDELFGVFSLFAPMWEANEQEKKVTNYLKTTLGLATEQLRGIFLARLEGRKTGQNPLGLELSKFSSKQANFIQQWVQGRINLVQKSNTTTSAASSGD